jgi:DNA excision repair protein ERCC-4
VVELEVVMTPAMEEIYAAVAELMDSCIKELRKSNKIDASELTIENGIFRSFDDMVRRQLDSVWHTVSPRTKQVIIPYRNPG